jgi:hypothetical protein
MYNNTSLRTSFLQGGGDVIGCHMYTATAVSNEGQLQRAVTRGSYKGQLQGAVTRGSYKGQFPRATP